MDKPLKDWTLEEIGQECKKTRSAPVGDKRCFDVCKLGDFCFSFFNDIEPEYWYADDRWNKTP